MKHFLVSMISEANTLIEKKTSLKDCNLQLEELKELMEELSLILHQIREKVEESELSKETEIFCFKEVKPHILGRLMFLKQVYILKTTESVESPNFQRSLYKRKQDYIDNELSDNIELYRGVLIIGFIRFFILRF
ncbi:MAG: RteC domain-containing protein [Rikenellaceae bacterium]